MPSWSAMMWRSTCSRTVLRTIRLPQFTYSRRSLKSFTQSCKDEGLKCHRGSFDSRGETETFVLLIPLETRSSSRSRCWRLGRVKARRPSRDGPTCLAVQPGMHGIGRKRQPLLPRVRCRWANASCRQLCEKEVSMSLKGKHALITGSSRGIGRGIALKLAEHGAKVAIHYYQNEPAAKETLAKVREQGSEGFFIQADVSRPDHISRMFRKVQSEFGKLDIFVSNARPEVPAFFQPPMDITL